MSYKNRVKYPEVQTISKIYKKKGKIKGRNKNETKLLRATCTHHVYTKNEKLKPVLIAKDNVVLICKVCGARFTAQFKTKEEKKEIIGSYREMLDQLKFISVAVGADKKTVSFITQQCVNLITINKISKKLYKVADKSSSKDKRKKNKGYKQNQMGSWNVN